MTETRVINTQEARDIINELKTQKVNELVHLSFTKKDGSVRNAHASFRVLKEIKGTGPMYDPTKHDEAFFYEMKKLEGGQGHWKTVTINRLRSITRKKVKYVVRNGQEDC